MKKIIAVLLTLLLAVSLAACVQESPTPTDEPTAGPTDAPTTAPTTVVPATDDPTQNPSEAPTTEPEEEQSEVAQFQEMLSAANDYWYNRILGCTFAEAKDISLEHLFYNGMAPEERTSSAEFTDDEVNFLKNALKDTMWGEENWTNAHKMPAAQVKDVLNTYLGVSLEEMRLPENWLYFADTDAYYCVKTDGFSVGNYREIHVKEYDDGTVEIFWTVDFRYDTVTEDYENDAEMLLTLRQVEDRYVAVSNIPLPETEK